MPRFTVACSELECDWEEDRSYDSVTDAEEDVAIEACPRHNCAGAVVVTSS